MFEKYNEDVTGFAMFKFKNPADFYDWMDGNPEFAEGDYIYIDPTQPFMGSTCDTGYGEGIYDICDDHGRPFGNYYTMAFSAKEVMAYLVRVGTPTILLDREIEHLENKLAELREAREKCDKKRK